MNVILALARLHILQILRSGTRSGRPRPGFRASGPQIYLLVILIFLGWQVYRLATHWVSQSSLARDVIFILFRPALTLLGSAAVVVILFYAFTSLIGTFTEQADLRLLLLAPARPALVIGEKLLLTSLGFSGTLLVAVPACFAVGNAVNVPPWYYVAVLAAVVILPVAPVSLGALVLTAVLRWLPSGRARTVSAAVGTLLAVSFFLAARLTQTGKGRALPELPAWLPSTWPGRFVADIGLGKADDALRDGALMAALAVALLVVAATVAARVLATGSASYTEERRRERGHVPTAAPAPVVALPLGARRSRPEISRPRPVWWTILRNDLLALRRDTQRLLTFVFPLIVVGFNAYSILSRSSAQHTVALGTTLFLLVMVTLLLVNTTAPGTVNMGGRAILLFGLAPISLTEVLKAKWIGAGVLPLVLTEIALLVFAVYLRLPPSQFLLVGLALAALAVALAGVTLAANVAWPKLDAINPRRPASVTATIVSLATDAALSGYVLLMLVLDIFVWHGIRAGLAVVGLFLGLAAVIVACWTVTPALLQRLFYRADGVD